MELVRAKHKDKDAIFPRIVFLEPVSSFRLTIFSNAMLAQPYNWPTPANSPYQ